MPCFKSEKQRKAYYATEGFKKPPRGYSTQKYITTFQAHKKRKGLGLSETYLEYRRKALRRKKEKEKKREHYARWLNE